jgi:signal peptidase I
MFKFLRFILMSYLIVAALGCLAWLVLWRTQGVRLYSVQTGSMAPTIQPGDLVVSTKINPSNLQVGDIVSYKGQPGAVTHRVYKIFNQKDYLVTKGDNLTQPDPPVSYDQITGKTIKVIPRLGHLFDFLRRPVGLISLVYAPALLIVSIEMYHLAGHFNRRLYRQPAH